MLDDFYNDGYQPDNPGYCPKTFIGYLCYAAATLVAMPVILAATATAAVLRNNPGRVFDELTDTLEEAGNFGDSLLGK